MFTHPKRYKALFDRLKPAAIYTLSGLPTGMNRILCRIAQPHNFLAFEFMEYGVEREHLRQPTDNHHELSEMDAMIVAMKEENPSISNKEIARQLNTNPMKVKRVLERNSFYPEQ